MDVAGGRGGWAGAQQPGGRAGGPGNTGEQEVSRQKDARQRWGRWVGRGWTSLSDKVTE